MSAELLQQLNELGLRAIKELEVEQGLLASARDEAYGCVFGRDSLISALELMRAYERGGRAERYFLDLTEKILRSLSSLQGRHYQPESGEEPGKIIHEYRPERHEHLTALREDPWFIYPEGVMRNYDSVDATPLYLIAVHEFRRLGGERAAVEQLMPSVRAALRWLGQFDGFISYRFDPDRTHGGLRTQSWMDSTESVFYENAEERPPYPLAPVEAQAYAWSALKRWGEDARAAKLKAAFNDQFLLRRGGSVSLAFALDGAGKKLSSARSSMGHVLWAAYGGECILKQEYMPALRDRLLARDLFVPKAGIRTLSSRSRRFDPMSYHNGSIWPHDTALLAEGLEQFGYSEDAKRVREALLSAYVHFNTPIELFSYRRGILEYETPEGHRACRTQAWSAASLLAILAA